MNERIKQLLGQAYDEAVPETWTTLSSEQLGRIYEKFAELIVRETIKQMAIRIAKAGDEQSNNPAWYKAEQDTREHFGVEE